VGCPAKLQPGALRQTLARSVQTGPVHATVKGGKVVTARFNPREIPRGRTLMLPVLPAWRVAGGVTIAAGRAVRGRAPACLPYPPPPWRGPVTVQGVKCSAPAPPGGYRSTTVPGPPPPGFFRNSHNGRNSGSRRSVPVPPRSMQCVPPRPKQCRVVGPSPWRHESGGPRSVRVPPRLVQCLPPPPMQCRVVGPPPGRHSSGGPRSGRPGRQTLPPRQGRVPPPPMRCVPPPPVHCRVVGPEP
jgi:hypothetical protein